MAGIQAAAQFITALPEKGAEWKQLAYDCPGDLYLNSFRLQSISELQKY